MKGAALPPAPPVPKAVQALGFWKSNLPFLRWCRSRRGEIFTVWAPPWGNIVFVSGPRGMKDVFTADPAAIHPGEAYATIFGTVMGPRSLFTLDEDDHLRTRKIMLPPFHGDHVKGYRAIVQEIADAEVAMWPVGEPFALEDRMKALTLEVMLRVVFGVTGEARLAQLRGQVPATVDPGTLLQLGWVRPELQRFGPWKRHQRLVEDTDRLLLDEIRGRRADPLLDERTDVLSMLIRARFPDGSGFSDQDLRDELWTLLLAGHETTASQLAWSFERILRHPGVLARLRAELDDEPGGGAYLDAVVKEAQRNRPVVTNVIRRVVRDVDVGGFRLPAGTWVMPSIGALHHADDLHDDAERFRPERFLEGSPEPYTWLPFGVGRKRCLGASLATLELKVVIATAIDRLELAPSRRRDERLKVKHVTTVPARGGEIVVTARREPKERPCPPRPSPSPASPSSSPAPLAASAPKPPAS